MLKNILLKFCCFLLLACFLPSLQAQYYDHSFGIRAGTNVQLSYKRFLFYEPTHIQQSIEGLFGVQLDLLNRQRTQNGYVLEALYNLHMDLGFDNNISGYVGAGLFGGIYTQVGQANIWGGGVTATVGIEYTFTHVPINISLDWRPFFGYPRISLINSGITIRYVFPTTWQ